MSLNTCGRKVVLAGSYLSDLNTQPVRVQHGRVTFNQDVTYIVRNNLLCVFFSRILLGKANVKGIFFFNTAFLFCRFSGWWSEWQSGLPTRGTPLSMRDGRREYIQTCPKKSAQRETHNFEVSVRCVKNAENMTSRILVWFGLAFAFMLFKESGKVGGPCLIFQLLSCHKTYPQV